MYTKIKETDGTITVIASQQYEIGLYVIINNNPALQFTSNLPENEFHRRIRHNALKRDAVILDGNIIKCRNKKLNIFEEQ